MGRSIRPLRTGEESPPENSREFTVSKEIKQLPLKRVLAHKTLKPDFLERGLAKRRASTPEERHFLIYKVTYSHAETSLASRALACFAPELLPSHLPHALRLVRHLRLR